MSPSEIDRLADLESREVLLAMLAGAMKASMANAVATMAALPTQMARLAAALEAKRTSQEGAPAPSETENSMPNGAEAAGGGAGAGRRPAGDY